MGGEIKGTAFMVDCLTDNKNKTESFVKVHQKKWW